MQMYPAYNQSFFEEEDYSSKDEFRYNSSSMNMMKGDNRCPTPPVQQHGYQQNFDKITHGYTGGHDHSFDKASPHGFAAAGHHQNSDKFTHGGFGHEQSFDKVSHGYGTGNKLNMDKFTHGGGHGYEQNFDKTTHGGYAGFDQGLDKFNKHGGGGYNASQYQSSNFEKEGHRDAWSGGNDYFGHGGGGHGNRYASGMPHNFGTSGGHGGHQGGHMPMGGGHGGHQGSPKPMGGVRHGYDQNKGVTPTWNFKGISDF